MKTTQGQQTVQMVQIRGGTGECNRQLQTSFALWWWLMQEHLSLASNVMVWSHVANESLEEELVI